MFLSVDRYCLNDRYFLKRQILMASKAVIREENHAPPYDYGAEDASVYYPRLQRDGWRLVECRENGKHDAATIFEKRLSNDLALRKITHEQIGSLPGKGCYWDEHELLGKNGNIKPLPDWEWAEWDCNRLVWAEQGRLWQAGYRDNDFLGEETLLHDFNAYRFEPIEAPY